MRPLKKDTICRLCSSCCPVEATIEGGRLVKAERKSFLPEKKRMRCPKLNAAADIVYSPERLKTPLIRENRKSGTLFREASWDEALDHVAGKFKFFKETHGPQFVCWLRGMAADWGAPWDYANRFMNVYGSPNSIGNGSVCHVAREMAHTYTYGAMTAPDFRQSRCIVVWGKNDGDTNPQAFENIIFAKEQGAKLIVIDPIRTGLASMADMWLQIKPGHDGLLAMSIIHEIISKNLFDESFVQDWTVGFEALKDAAGDFEAEKIAEGIWLEPEEIRNVARLYATTRPACIIDGNGLDMQLNVFQQTRAVCILRGLTGNLDKPGGDLIPQPIPIRNIQLKDRLPEGIKSVAQGYPLFNTFHKTWGINAQSSVVDAILDKEPYPLKMLVVQSGNPAVTMADSNRAVKAFQRLDFMVVLDLFMTKTAKMAHVVLPACSSFEKTQLNRAFIRNSPIILQNRVIDCVGDSWPDWKITFELARRLGMDKEFPWKSAEEVIDYQLEPAGISVDMLRKTPGGVRFEDLTYEKYKARGFQTPSGKMEIHSQRLKDAGQPPVPVFGGDALNPISFYNDRANFPVVGISGARTRNFTHSQFKNIPSLLKRERGYFIDIHPEDAREQGINEGSRVRVETPKGSVHMQVRISNVVHPGSVRIGWGWGNLDSRLNLNNLTDDDKRDPVTGTPSSRSFMCRLTKEKHSR
jgi:anaerobic selenocysteine-containing dehydrogenase